MLFKLWSYILGYVLIRVEGVALEKFVNMAISRGIYLWDITVIGDAKLLIKVRINSFRSIRHIAKKLGCRIKIQEKRGLPFLVAYLKKRKMLVVGAVTFFIALYLFSSFVWFVDVQGNEQISSQIILKSLKNAGLERGTPKWEINTKEIEEQVSQDIQELAWIGVKLKGTKAIVEVAEKRIAKEDKNEKKPAHIVANKGGLIKELLVMSGEAAVEEGEMVEKGQILISGIIMPPEEQLVPTPPTEEDQEQEPLPEPKYVHAKGIAKARVWYQTIGQTEILQTKYIKTGRSVSNFRIKIRGKDIILRGPKTTGFKHFVKEEEVENLFSWRNIKVPVEVISTTFYETKQVKKNLGYSGAKTLAVEAAEKNIMKKIPSDAQVVNKEIEKLKTVDNNKVRFKVTVEAIENIGKLRYIEGKAY